MSNEVKVKITGDSASLQTALTDAGKHIGGLGKKAKEAEAPIASLANGLKTAFVGSSVAVGLISLKNSIAHVTGELVQAQIQVDKLRNGLNFAVGRDKAAADMAFIRQSAQAMGLSFVGAAEQYMRLAAASRGTTLEGQKTRDIFTAVAQASTVMGLSAEETEGAFRAIGQMISKNTIMSEELKGQLGERLPGAFQVAARSMGVTTGELNKMLETGQVLAEDFLPKFARQLSGEVAPEVDTASQSMQASINRMTTAWQVFKQTVTQSGASKVIANEATGLGNYLTLLSESMDRAKKSGSGFAGQMDTLFATMLYRAPFDLAAGSVNLLNGSVNLLSGGLFNFRTNFDFLPAAFETSAQKAAALTGRLAEAETDLAQLQSKLALVPDNYLKSETYQAFLLVQQLRAAKEAQDKLKGVAPSGLDGARKFERESSAAWERQHTADLLSLAGIRNKANGVPDGYAKNMAEIIRLNQAGVLVGKEYTTVLAQQQALLSKKAGGGSGVSELSKALGIYNDLTARATGLNSDFSEKWAGLSLAYRAGKISVDQLTDAQARLLTEQTFAKDAAKEQEERVKEITKAYQEAEKEQAKYTESVSADLAKMVEQTQAQQDLNDRLGLGKDAIAALDAASLELQATKLDGLAIDRLVQYQDTINFASLKAQAEELRKLAALKRQGAAKEAQIDAAKAAADAWEKASDQINTSLTDALMRGFEDGKGFAQNLRDTVVNMFKTMVLRPVVSAVMNPIAQGLTGAMGLSGMAQAGQAGAGSFAGSALGSLTVAGSSLAAIGSSIGTGFMATLTGSSVAGASAAYSAAGMTGVSAGLSVGAAMPYVAAALIAYKMLNGGETRSGATYDTVDGKAHLQQGPSGGEIEGTQARALFDSTQASINNMLKALGSKSVLTGYVAGLESSDNGKGFSFAGGYIGDRGFGENLGRSGGQFAMVSQDSKTAFDAYGRELSQSIIEALQVTTDIPKTISDMLAGVDVKSLTTEATTALLANINAVVATVNGFNAVAKTLPFEALKNLGFDAAAGLIAAAGGLDKLGANLGSYYDNFYSDAERRAQQVKTINAALLGTGFDAATATRDQFRALVDAQDVTTDAGRAMYARLLDVAGAFATVATASEASATAMQKSAEDAARAMQRSMGSIDEEVRRIRGEAAGGGAQGYASAQAAFAIATGQARAGDATALDALPKLSRAMLDLAQGNLAGVELRRARALTANSLEDTGRMLLPGAGPAPVVPLDMIAPAYQVAPAVARTNGQPGGGDTRRMEELSEAGNRQLEKLREEIVAIAIHTEKLARTLNRVVAPEGDALATREKTP